MDILDELYNTVCDEEETSNVQKIIDAEADTFEGNIGDVCFYNVVNNSFDLASAKDYTKYDANLLKDWKSIILGIALNEDEKTKTFDILMAGFLMAKPLEIPYKYNQQDKRPYIRAYAFNMFQRYVSAFFKQCPGYKEFLNLDITMPTASDMLKIQKFSNEIFDSLEVVADQEKFKEFIDRLFNNYIYVRHTNKKIYQMKISKNEDEQPDIQIPSADISADFLCVFRNVDIFGKYTNNKLENNLEEDELVYFK